MKKIRFTSIILVVTALFILTVPVFAVQYASNQIDSYTINVECGTNTIDVKFSVSGNAVMDKIGCESICIYEKIGARWKYSDNLSLFENNSGMSKYNSALYKNTIYCSKSSATEYKVVVTVFAEDSQGRDTRTKTFYV